MGLFNAAANLFGQVYERATQVAATAVTAVADVARTLVGSTVDAAEQQVHEALTSVHDAVASVEQALEGTVGAVASTLGEIAGDALDTVGSAVGTLGGLAGNSLAIADDLLHGRVEPEDYLKLVGDLGQGVGATVGHAWEFGSDSLKAANDLYHAAYQGGSLSLGNSDGLLGVNVIGSLLGGNHDQGVIPDSRGILGPLPINVSLTEQGLTFGGETPLTPLVTAALALNPITAPLVPVLAPLNLGGLGVVGSVDKEGFSAKFYGIAGPSYNLGVANLGGTLELGSYNEVKLLSWNEVTLRTCPSSAASSATCRWSRTSVSRCRRWTCTSTASCMRKRLPVSMSPGSGRRARSSWCMTSTMTCRSSPVSPGIPRTAHWTGPARCSRRCSATAAKRRRRQSS
ncbi:hypothetical protein KZ798_26125 [Pseudomonas aeruginosa]|nr:hypothetical protein KZ798_26125 [Pseudomonas aeruginosa]